MPDTSTLLCDKIVALLGGIIDGIVTPLVKHRKNLDFLDFDRVMDATDAGRIRVDPLAELR